jgi:arylsulfatase A-like enzyme/Flp pilus assembly protein TadD
MTAAKLSSRIAIGIVLLAAAGLLAIRRPWNVSPATRSTTVSRLREPDILLVTIDTVRADAVGFSGNARVETPHLDRLARAGLLFSNAHAHNLVTLPSHVNILTGLYPYQHGVRDNSGFLLDPSVPTLATMLKAKGYATGAFVAAFPLDSRFGLARGFDVYDDRYPKGKTSLDFEMAERPGSEVVAAARRWYAENAGHRRFLFVHLYEPHAPYRPPSPFAERYRDEPYLGEVAAADAALAPLLDPFLSGEADPALIVLTSDHGEALGDHEEKTHGLFAYEATLHVPLAIWFRGAVPSGVNADLVRHVDIAPTILEAAGIQAPAGLPGTSLLSRRPARPAESCYFEAFSAAYNRGWAPLRGVLSGGYKFIDLPLPELYDLKADPGETRNLADTRPDLVRKLRGEIPPESRIGEAARSKAGAEEVRRLASLGYLTGSSPVRKSYTVEDDPKRLIAVDRDLHRCVDLYQRGDQKGATEIARRLVRERPTMAYAYENLGFLLRQGGKPSEALNVYRAAVERGIATEELKTQFALALSEAGRPREAIQLLQPLSESRDPDTWNALGIALADSGRGAEALSSFRRALELDKENVEAYENMGIVRLRENDPSGAQDLFRQALAIEQRLPRAWNGLGVALAHLGREREAIQSWEKAVALDPSLYDALFNLGLTAGKNGLHSEARQALERFVATAPPARYPSDIREARRLLKARAESGP